MGQPEGYKNLSVETKEIYGRRLAALLWMDMHGIWKLHYEWDKQIFWGQLSKLGMDEKNQIFCFLGDEWNKWAGESSKLHALLSVASQLNIVYDAHGNSCEKETDCLLSWWEIWYHAELREILSPCMGTTVCPVSIKECVSIFLIALKCLYLETVRCNPQNAYELTDPEWKCMGNAAIATFLRQWLTDQPEMQMTIYDYSKNYFKYSSPSEREADIGEIDVEARDRAMRDSYLDIDTMQKMRKIQADEEGSIIKDIPVREKDGYALPLTTLYEMECIARRKLDTRWDITIEGKDHSCMRIFKYISQRKTPLKVAGENAEIYAACQDYVNVLKEISRLEKKAIAGDADAARNYVIGSMMVMEQEEASRLFFASTSAVERQRRKQKKGREKDEEVLACGVLARFPASRAWLQNSVQGIQDPTKGSSVVAEPAHNILNYERDIRYIYSATPEQQESFQRKMIVLRYSQLIILVALRELFLEKDLRKWEASDYQEAAYFWGKEYNVVKALLKIQFPECEVRQRSTEDGERKRRKKDHYDRMREFFVMVQSWSEKYRVGLDKSASPYETYRKVRGGAQKGSK